MAQRRFEHWWATLSDSSYAGRCHRKNHFRQHASFPGEHHVDQDVWVRQPGDGFMYIASINATYRSSRTCTLPINHLRRVTLEDIQLNRSVDYGTGWTERTRYSEIVTYDRYGEQQYPQFYEPLPNSTDDIDASHSYPTTGQGTSCSLSALYRESSTFGCSRPSVSEPIWIRIPHPEDPTATYSHRPIWNAVSYAEAEQQALEMCRADIHRRGAQQRAKRRLVLCEPLIPPSFYFEEPNKPNVSNPTVPINGSPADSTYASSDSLSPTTQPLSIAIASSGHLPIVQTCGVQTESCSSVTMTAVNPLHEQDLCTSFSTFTHLRQASTFDRTKVLNSRSLQYRRSICRNILSRLVYGSCSRFRHTYNSVFSTNFIRILLFLILTYQLLTELLIPTLEIAPMTPITTCTIPVGATNALTAAIFVYGLSLLATGTTSSLFEQWPYPFTIP